MAIWIYVLLFIAFLLFAGALIWLLYIFFREDEKAKDDTIIFNLGARVDNTGGRAILIERGHSTQSYTGRSVVTAEPRDIDTTKPENKEIRITGYGCPYSRLTI